MHAPLRHVSDTALWVAMYRAFESERPDALFRDPFARRLAGERGEAIVEALPRGRSLAWPMVVRTAVMDEIITRCVDRGVRTVINLAAGLDARAYRMALPPALRWLDVDLPDMIAYRREHLGDAKPVCACESVAADLSDPAATEAVLAREVEFQSVWEESLRLGRSVPLARLWNFLGRFRSKAVREAYRRMSAIVLLERA